MVEPVLSFGLEVHALEEEAIALGLGWSPVHDHDVGDLASVGAPLCTKIPRTC